MASGPRTDPAPGTPFPSRSSHSTRRSPRRSADGRARGRQRRTRPPRLLRAPRQLEGGLPAPRRRVAPPVGRRRKLEPDRDLARLLRLEPARLLRARGPAAPHTGHPCAGHDSGVLRPRAVSSPDRDERLRELRACGDAALPHLRRPARHRGVPGLERGQRSHLLVRHPVPARPDDPRGLADPSAGRPRRHHRGSPLRRAARVATTLAVGVPVAAGRQPSGVALLRRQRPQPLPEGALRRTAGRAEDAMRLLAMAKHRLAQAGGRRPDRCGPPRSTTA